MFKTFFAVFKTITTLAPNYFPMQKTLFDYLKRYNVLQSAIENKVTGYEKKVILMEQSAILKSIKNMLHA